jgi:hypothetical protein
VIEAPAILQQALTCRRRINPRTRALASEWASRPPEEIAAAALAMFRNEDFYYTLRPPLLGANAMDEFLFDSRRGFCEHYASAFVFLMRAAGVPARVVAGYQGGELNPVDGYLVVRQSDAHAWAEIWLAGKGWVRFDPTAAVAPSRIEQGIVAALPAGEPLPMHRPPRQPTGCASCATAGKRPTTRGISGYSVTIRNASAKCSRASAGVTPTGAKHEPPRWPSSVACPAARHLWTLPRRLAADPVQRAWQKYCAALKRNAEYGAPNGKARSISRSGWPAKDPILPPSPRSSGLLCRAALRPQRRRRPAAAACNNAYADCHREGENTLEKNTHRPALALLCSASAATVRPRPAGKPPSARTGRGAGLHRRHARAARLRHRPVDAASSPAFTRTPRCCA